MTFFFTKITGQELRMWIQKVKGQLNLGTHSLHLGCIVITSISPRTTLISFLLLLQSVHCSLDRHGFKHTDITHWETLRLFAAFCQCKSFQAGAEVEVGMSVRVRDDHLCDRISGKRSPEEPGHWSPTVLGQPHEDLETRNAIYEQFWMKSFLDLDSEIFIGSFNPTHTSN